MVAAKGNHADMHACSCWQGWQHLVNQARLAVHCCQVEHYCHSACDTAFDTAALRFASLDCSHYFLGASMCIFQAN